MITTRAPGKLYVAGEYAVVEPGEPAVLIAVDRYLTVTLTESVDAGRIRSGEYGQSPLVWTRADDGVGVILEHRPSDYVLSAIETVEHLRGERGLAPRYYDLDIGSELDDPQGRKFGLGSSAAVTVAVIAALDEFYSLGLTLEERFRISLLATILVAPNASGGDLAASTVGGWVRYTAPDRAALRIHLEAEGVSAALHSPAWDLASLRRVTPPSDLQVLVGWTGKPASTERLVAGVRRRPVDTTALYEDFRRASAENVDGLVSALEEGRLDDVLDRIRTARRLLRHLGELSGIDIETPLLTSLCDTAELHGAAGKPSGAGGGDCGIVLAPAGIPTDRLCTDWEGQGIRRLDLAVHPPAPELAHG